MNLKEVRKRFPEYAAIDDAALTKAMHKKFATTTKETPTTPGSVKIEAEVSEDIVAATFEKSVTKNLEPLSKDISKNFAEFASVIDNIQKNNAVTNEKLIEKIEGLTDNKSLMKFLLELPKLLKEQSDTNSQLVLTAVKSLPSPVFNANVPKPEVIIQQTKPRRLEVTNIQRDTNRDLRGFVIEVSDD